MDGLLCQPFHGVGNATPHRQVLIPSNLRNVVLKQLHDQSAHLRMSKTTGKVKELFYWPGYEQDIEVHVQECEECQRCNPPQRLPIAPLGTIKAQRPFERVSWDLMDPFPQVTRETSTHLLLHI